MESEGLIHRQNVKNSEKNETINDQQDEEMEPLPSEPSGEEEVPQDKGNIEVLDSALKDLTPRWKNWVIRGIFSIIMISGFCVIIYMGPLAVTLLVLAIQVKCYHEIITIGYVVYKSHHLPWFRTISWYFLIASNYYFYGESLIEKFGLLLRRDDFLQSFVQYHRFISFSLYTAGFIGFVLTLKKTYYLKQFTLFGYTHLALFLIVAQSHVIIQNIFEGLIWFIVPISVIICNDIAAYMFGFFFGRTKLIKLSPKKTWEGFIGGAFATIIFGFILSMALVKHKYCICPLEYDEARSMLSTDCTPNRVFQMQVYNLPAPFSLFKKQIDIEPFVLHSFSISLFASTVGPFAGFFASGFKRAFKIKDFGDTIPGHGGFTDRFDCQIIMATFVKVYISTFIRDPTPLKLFNQLLSFNKDDQNEFFRLIENHFKSQ